MTRHRSLRVPFGLACICEESLIGRANYLADKIKEMKTKKEPKQPSIQCVSPGDRAYVAALVAESGVYGAAAALKLSRLAVINIAIGRPVLSKTRAAIAELRGKAA